MPFCTNPCSLGVTRTFRDIGFCTNSKATRFELESMSVSMSSYMSALLRYAVIVSAFHQCYPAAGHSSSRECAGSSRYDAIQTYVHALQNSSHCVQPGALFLSGPLACLIMTSTVFFAHYCVYQSREVANQMTSAYTSTYFPCAPLPTCTEILEYLPVVDHACA